VFVVEVIVLNGNATVS